MQVLFRLAAWLVLPLALLLFAQWPLREWLQAGSRAANDAAQILFALYAAVAVTAASRHGAHLAAPQPRGPRLSARARRWALALCIAPWAAWALWSSAGELRTSLAVLERFPETAHPGYFVVKLAAWLLLVLALIDALHPARNTP